MTVSIGIMPDGTSDGALEDLCLRSIEVDLIGCVNEYVECVNTAGPKIASNRLAKVKVFSYFATGPVRKFPAAGASASYRRRSPGLRLGDAAEAGVWDWRSDAFKQVANFLQNL